MPQVQPVQVAEGTAVQTNRQAKEHLLCGACEGRFARWEDALARLVVQEDGSFPWLESVAPAPRPKDNFAADSSFLDSGTMALVAASIAWRGSVSKSFPTISMGPYEDAFRRYLLGEAAFPERARLHVTLNNQSKEHPRVDRIVSMPQQSRRLGVLCHWFVICGVRFELFVGKTHFRDADSICFLRTRQVYVSDWQAFIQVMGEQTRAATPKGKLAAGRTRNGPV